MSSREDLKYFQAMPLEVKVGMTKTRIREWVKEYGTDGVYVSFSGGKDSTVLLHIAREMYPNIEAVFVDTGLEYPEIRKFVKSFENVTILHPKMRFDEVIQKYGYPLISKEVGGCVFQGRKCLANNSKHSYRLKQLFGTLTDKNGNKSLFCKEKYKPLLYTDFICGSYCCNIMKKNPAKAFVKKTDKKPITAQMASESNLREQQWLRNGCNGFEMKSPISNPMSFWIEQDILQYIKQNNLPIASVYGDIVDEAQIIKSGGDIFEQQPMFENCGGNLTTTGCKRTGCMFCGFGCHLEKESRWLGLKNTHPRQYEYCIGGGEYNEEGIWQPNSKGLGLGHCFDVLNELYGKDFIKYKED